MSKIFGDFDIAGFWVPSEYALKEYVDVPVTDEMVAAVERKLGYKLPAAYVELMRHQNGGIPRRTDHRTLEATSWAHDHIAITGIFSIGRDKPSSLCGEVGSRFWVEEWGYPEIGIYFADCPSAGHDMICLDYRACGPTGEPRVVHVDQESDYKIVHVADNFEAFIRGLEDESAFAGES
ncbi:SMI1/KNR4 family protein [Singulisphaera sp. PoT]|uniref:SMI1/KNR4 family protein n=1 Tax=Singulisphaera sp. PoT TaxID=3411797 RepID=UPI003BF4C472